MDPNQQPPNQENNPHPITYDKDGNPISPISSPNVTAPQQQPTPQVVHLSRAVEPIEPEISPEVKAKHEESVRRYPSLNLSPAEFVISAVRRHPIGLVPPLAITIFLVAFVASMMINYNLIVNAIGILNPPSYDAVLFIGSLLILLFLIGGYIAYWVYTSNHFFLTNIEDASFLQQGFIQSLLNYGSIRLSTEGDETTYRFSYVANPKKEIAILNNAVEAFKNGRPVVDDSDN
jgi:hypothetical protein